MEADDLNAARKRHLAACLSLLVPGLGQAFKHEPVRAIATVAIAGLILACGLGVARLAGTGAGILFQMLFLLPWWAFQSYDAWLPPAPIGRSTFRKTWRLVWARAHDVRYLGLLFLLTSATDLYIIVTNPSYSLMLFCTKPAGVWGLLAKAQSPTLHILIGYGFLRLRRWGLLLYGAYAAFGLLNASTNFACFGYGRVRTVFVLTLAAFTAYVLWRSPCFAEPPKASGPL